MTRHPGAAVLAAWGVLNVALSTLMFVFTTDVMSHVVYWAANAITFAVAAAAVFARSRERRALPDASASVVALALAVAFGGVAAGIGSWAVFLAAAALLVALFLLAMERRA